MRWSRFAHAGTDFAGSLGALVALGVLATAWLVWGIVTGFPRAWELAVTTGLPWLTVVLLVVLQHAQNRQARASHLKLDELLCSLEEPDSRIVRAEDKSDAELHALSHEVRGRIEEHRERGDGGRGGKTSAARG